MAEWRFARGWSEGELEARRRGLEARARSFEDAGPLAPERGWNHVRSDGVLAREAPGPPRPGAAFERARALVERLEFSDPRIVVAHLDSRTPLRARVMLFELRALGFHFLSPVVVADVDEVRDAAETRFAFSIETLPGHLEHGREWFRLDKDHATGLVRFRIEAAWRPGAFPGPWARLGFLLLGRRYQRAWHRLSHVRLRRLVAAGATPGAPGPEREGPPLATPPVRFFARRARGRRRSDVEVEQEARRLDRPAIALGLAALCGARTAVPVAALALALRRGPAGAARPRGGAGVLRRRGVAPVLAAGALAELAADKLPSVPSRLSPFALAGRAAAGAVVSREVVALGGRRRWVAAGAGAAAAVAGALGSARLRAAAARRLGGAAAAVAEDALVLGAAAALARRARGGGAAVAPHAA